MSVTVTSSDHYTIVVNNDQTNTASFRVMRPVGIVHETVMFVPGAPGNQETTGAMEWVSAQAVLQRSGGIIFHAPSGGDLAEFANTGPVVQAKINNGGVLVLSGGSLRLPVVTSLPSSPEEGECLIYKNNGSGWMRIGAYLNGGWRYSGNI